MGWSWKSAHEKLFRVRAMLSCQEGLLELRLSHPTPTHVSSPQKHVLNFRICNILRCHLRSPTISTGFMKFCIGWDVFGHKLQEIQIKSARKDNRHFYVPGKPRARVDVQQISLQKLRMTLQTEYFPFSSLYFPWHSFYPAAASPYGLKMVARNKWKGECVLSC